MIMDVEKRREKARMVVKSLNKLRKWGLQFLLRSNNTFGGIVYNVEHVPAKDFPGYRKVLYLITPDGRDVQEYADWYYRGKYEDCIILSYPDAPFLLTIRKRPGLTDEADDIEWLLRGYEAEYVAQLKVDVATKQKIIEELTWHLEQLKSTNEKLDLEVKRLREQIREYEAEIDHMSTEVTDLRTTLRNIAIIAEKYMIGELEARKALSEILKKVESIGAYEVAGVKDRIMQILERDKEIKEQLELMYGPIEVDIKKTLEEIVEKKVREVVKDIVKEILLEIKEGKTNEKEKKTESEAEAGT